MRDLVYREEELNSRYIVVDSREYELDSLLGEVDLKEEEEFDLRNDNSI